LPELHFLTSRQQGGGEADGAARSGPDPRAGPATVRYSTDARARSGENGDPLRVFPDARALLDLSFAIDDFLGGLAVID
jgi:hypothetical protein